MRHRVLIATLIALLGAGFASTLVWCTATGCPSPLPNQRGWAKNLVHYSLAGLPNDQAVLGAARDAFATLSAVNQTINNKINFVEAQQGDTVDITFRVATAPLQYDDPVQGHVNVKAQEASTLVSASDTHVKSAVITIDLDNKGAPKPEACAAKDAQTGQLGTTIYPCQFFVPSAPNYQVSVRETIEHETMHSMGIDDVDAIARSSAGVHQTSIMLGSYSPNDCIVYAQTPNNPCTSNIPSWA